jgi:hypothetical protein
MARVNLFDFSDLLSCAERIGFDWNKAHDILVKDDVPPMYESKTKDFYINECTPEGNKNAYGYSDDTIKILQAFFKQEKIEEFTIT